MSHDDRVRQLSDLFIDDLRGPIEASLRQLLDQLMTIATEDRAAAVEEAVQKAGAEREAALEDTLRQAREEHDRALEALKAEHDRGLEAQRAQHEAALDALRTELSQAHDAAMAALRDGEATARDAALEAERDEVGGTHAASLAAQRDELTALHAAAMASLRDELIHDHEGAMAAVSQHLESEREAVAAQRADLEQAIAGVTRERDAARATVAELTDRLAEAHAQREHLAELANSESASAEEAESASVQARVEERQAELACSERLLAGFRDLDAAGSLSDILSVLAVHAASETRRVAVLLVQNGRLRGWRLSSMGEIGPETVDVPIENAGIIGRAVTTAAPVSTSEAADAPADGLPSCLVAPADRVGLALPLVVGGRVVAVLYADVAGAEQPIVPSNWPEAVELLVRHASRCLEVLTLARTTGAGPRRQAADAVLPAATAPDGPSAAAMPDGLPAAAVPDGPSAAAVDGEQEEESARRHARLLISEIKLYNEALVEQGRRDGNLLGLLGPEIERARRLYEEKIPAAVRQRVACFDEEIVRTLAGGDRALLGQTT